MENNISTSSSSPAEESNNSTGSPQNNHNIPSSRPVSNTERRNPQQDHSFIENFWNSGLYYWNRIEPNFKKPILIVVLLIFFALIFRIFFGSLSGLISSNNRRSSLFPFGNLLPFRE